MDTSVCQLRNIPQQIVPRFTEGMGDIKLMKTISLTRPRFSLSPVCPETAGHLPGPGSAQPLHTPSYRCHQPPRHLHQLPSWFITGNGGVRSCRAWWLWHCLRMEWLWSSLQCIQLPRSRHQGLCEMHLQVFRGHLCSPWGKTNQLRKTVSVTRCANMRNIIVNNAVRFNATRHKGRLTFRVTSILWLSA